MFILYNPFFSTDDLIEISEVALYKGDYSEQVYLVSGQMMDGVSVSSMAPEGKSKSAPCK